MARPAPLRSGRFGRLVGLAQAGLGLARGTFSADPVAPLERAADTLAELRGLATKAGQMAGVWSAMLPAEQRARAEPILARLRAHTATSAPDAVVKLVEEELRAPVSELFASFDVEPFASASLGQVHRAQLLDADGGDEVAVKVQHPGIEKALAADLDNAAQIGGVAALLAVPTAGAMVEEVRRRLEEELDYRHEAASQERFTELFAGDPDLSIPRVIAARSTRRVLTTAMVHGHGVAQAKDGPHARRQGRAIRRFLRNAWIEHGLLFADPHAGNWIFHDDGRVTVLDFGSVIGFDETERARFGAVLEAIAAGDASRARSLSCALLGVRGAATDMGEMLALALAPLASDRPLRVEGLARLATLSGEAKKKSLGSRMALPAWLPLTLRATVGIHALLVELEANVT